MNDTRSEIRSNTRALKILVAAVLITTAAVPVLANGTLNTVHSYQSANGALDAPSANKTPVYQFADNKTPDGPSTNRTPVYPFTPS